MEENNNISNRNSIQEQEIDLAEIAKKLWKERKLILKSCGWAVVIGLIVGFS